MEKIISIIMSLLAYFAAFFAPLFPNTDTYELFSDISYGTEIREVMDIYVPDSAYENDTNGCILFIHGGSWSNGDKQEMASRCIEMTKKGYITATMNYTLYSEENSSYFTVDIMLDEIGMAFEKIREISDENNLNINKAATSGFSSGAHISMLYSYTRAGTCPFELVFTANMVGPSDLSYEVWGDMCPVIVSGLSGETVTKEMVLSGKADEIIASVSPVTYVTSDTIPSLFAYGGKDMFVPAGNGEAIKAGFESTGAPYDYIFYPNSNHTLLNDPEVHETYIETLEEYCRTYFGY